MQQSLSHQVTRLLKAGLLRSVIRAVAESVHRKVEKRLFSSVSDDTRIDASRREAVPHIHNISHNLKKVAVRYGLRVTFSAPNKLAQLCRRTTSTERQGCTKKHARRFVRCCIEVVYEIPLSWGKSYVGQTGLNDRLREPT